MVVEINGLVRVIVVDSQRCYAHHVQRPDKSHARRNKPQLALPRSGESQYEPSKKGIKYQSIAGDAHNHGGMAAYQQQVNILRGHGGIEPGTAQYPRAGAGNVGAQGRIQSSIEGQPLLIAKKPEQVYARGYQQEAQEEPIARVACRSSRDRHRSRHGLDE